MKPADSTLNEAAMAAALQPWVAARNDHVVLLGQTLGRTLARLPHAYGLESMDLRETLNAFVGTVVGAKLDAILALHTKLVEVAGVGKVYDFGYADRYGLACLDEPKLKTMAFQTQSLTYIVALRPKKAFLLTRGEAVFNEVTVDSWKLDIRFCTQGRNSQDYTRPKLESLKMLTKLSAFKESDYFRYGDGRDRGYLCHVQPELLGDTETLEYEAKDMHWGAAMSYLPGVLGDLSAHASMADEMTPSA